jgi:hypothetical protein
MNASIFFAMLSPRVQADAIRALPMLLALTARPAMGRPEPAAVS